MNVTMETMDVRQGIKIVPMRGNEPDSDVLKRAVAFIRSAEEECKKPERHRRDLKDIAAEIGCNTSYTTCLVEMNVMTFVKERGKPRAYQWLGRQGYSYNEIALSMIQMARDSQRKNKERRKKREEEVAAANQTEFVFEEAKSSEAKSPREEFEQSNIEDKAFNDLIEENERLKREVERLKNSNNKLFEQMSSMMRNSMKASEYQVLHSEPEPAKPKAVRKVKLFGLITVLTSEV